LKAAAGRTLCMPDAPSSADIRTVLERTLAALNRPPGVSLPAIALGLGLLAVGAMMLSAGRGRLAGIAALITWTLIAALAGLMFFSSRRHYRLARCIEEADCLVRLRDWPAALVRLTQAAALGRRSEPARAAAVTYLGEIALWARHYDLAERAFEQAVQMEAWLNRDLKCRAQIGLIEAKLRSDQLTYVADAIAHMKQQDLPDLYKAKVMLLQCAHRLYTGHADEVATQAADLAEDFRKHLSTDAGYGYGLLAAALDATGQATAAARYWADATLLIKAESLTQRYPETQSVAGKFAPTKWPW